MRHSRFEMVQKENKIHDVLGGGGIMKIVNENVVLMNTGGKYQLVLKDENRLYTSLKSIPELESYPEDMRVDVIEAFILLELSALEYTPYLTLATLEDMVNNGCNDNEYVIWELKNKRILSRKRR